MQVTPGPGGSALKTCSPFGFTQAGKAGEGAVPGLKHSDFEATPGKRTQPLKRTPFLPFWGEPDLCLVGLLVLIFQNIEYINELKQNKKVVLFFH